MITESAKEVSEIVCGILEKFIATIESGTAGKQTAKIENVRFKDIFILYGLMPEGKCQLYLPGEIGFECVTLIYVPFPDCVIMIHSENCINFRWKVHHVNIEYN